MNDIDLTKLQVDRSTHFTPGKKRRFRIRWWFVVILLGAAAGGFFYLHPPALDVQTTQVVTAFPSQQYVVLNSTGYVVARRKAAVASKGTGRLEWLGVIEGSHVKEGQVVARLESRDVEASLESAVANAEVASAGVQAADSELADAGNNLQRMQNLYSKHFVSQVMYDEAKSRYSRAKVAVISAKASLSAAKANERFARNAVDYTTIKAPFDGVVISESANVGDIVTPLSSAADSKGAVVVMADMSTLEVDADVSESALADIHVNQPCEIVLDAFPDKRFRGVVSTIVPTVNRSSATVTTKVRIIDADPRIIPDMSAKVSFLTRDIQPAEEKPAMAVNPAAIVRRGNHMVAFRVGQDGMAHEVPVNVGAALGELVAVGGALHFGDLLVLKPTGQLHDKSRIHIAESK